MFPLRSLEEGSNMNCPHCGAALADNAKFCTTCGASLAPAPVDRTIAQPPVQAPQDQASAAPYGYAQAAPVQPQPQPAADGFGTDTRARANADLKQAKQAYKDARRAAGKSAAPKVIAAVLVAAVLVGGTAGGVWYLMNQQIQELNTRIDELSEEAEKQQDESAQADGEAEREGVTVGTDEDAERNAAAVADAAADEEPDLSRPQTFVGTWTGELSKTEATYGSANCYAAADQPIELTLKSVNDTTGQMKFDVKLVYHGHDGLDSDADTVEGDQVLTFNDVTATWDMEEDTFGVRLDIEGAYEESCINLTGRMEDYSYGARIEIDAESVFETTWNDQFTDHYTLKKS